MKISAAQYLRMSTEHQQYSLDNQSAAIREYASAHGFEIIQTYRAFNLPVRACDRNPTRHFGGSGVIRPDERNPFGEHWPTFRYRSACPNLDYFRLATTGELSNLSWDLRSCARSSGWRLQGKSRAFSSARESGRVPKTLYLKDIPFSGNHLVQHRIDEESDEKPGDQTCHDDNGEGFLSIGADSGGDCGGK